MKSGATHPRSAIYAGQVMHHRLRPKQHRFVYKVSSFLFDLDELEVMTERCRWFSLNRFNLFSFFYRDVGAGRDQHPRDYLQQLLASQGIRTPLQRASLLCYPRILGYAFNPLAVYFCYDSAGAIFAIVYEVSNTFGERHSYLMPLAEPRSDNKAIHQYSDKQFYVSPFMSLDQRYHFRVNPPGERMTLAIRQFEQEQPMLTAMFQGEYRPFTDRQLLKTFFALPLMTLKVTAAIHWEALKLVIKGVRLHTRTPAGKFGLSVQDN